MGGTNGTQAKLKEQLLAADYHSRSRHRSPTFYASGIEFAREGAARALDAGCGSGGFTLPLARRVRWVVGLDANETLIAMARERAAEEGLANIAWVVGDMQHLPFAAGTFDVVGSYNVLQFVRLEPALAELAQSVAQGGRLVARTPVLPPPLPFPLNDLRRFYQYLRHIPGYAREHSPGVALGLIVQEFPFGRGGASSHPPERHELERLAQDRMPGARVEAHEMGAIVFWER